tara:strand:- start:1448 stop:1813 length:366 start_codon:yes stop_codon:yes gene_type:complete
MLVHDYGLSATSWVLVALLVLSLFHHLLTLLVLSKSLNFNKPNGTPMAKQKSIYILQYGKKRKTHAFSSAKKLGDQVQRLGDRGEITRFHSLYIQQVIADSHCFICNHGSSAFSVRKIVIE